MSYIATVIDKNSVEVSLCDAIPDFVHAVKYDHMYQIEVIFDADSDWTPQLEDKVMDLISFQMPDFTPVYPI